MTDPHYVYTDDETGEDMALYRVWVERTYERYIWILAPSEDAAANEAELMSTGNVDDFTMVDESYYAEPNRKLKDPDEPIHVAGSVDVVTLDELRGE